MQFQRLVHQHDRLLGGLTDVGQQTFLADGSHQLWLNLGVPFLIAHRFALNFVWHNFRRGIDATRRVQRTDCPSVRLDNDLGHLLVCDDVRFYPLPDWTFYPVSFIVPTAILVD